MHAQAPMYVLSHSDTLTHKDIHSHAEAVGSRICICKSTHVLYTHPQGYALTRRGSWLTHLHLQKHTRALHTPTRVCTHTQRQLAHAFAFAKAHTCFTHTHKDMHSHAEAVGSRICICKRTHTCFTHTHTHTQYQCTHSHPRLHTLTPTLTHAATWWLCTCVWWTT